MNENQQTSPSVVKDSQREMKNNEAPGRSAFRTRSGRISKKPDRLVYK